MGAQACTQTPLPEKHGLDLPAFAAWRLDISDTGQHWNSPRGQRSGSNVTKISSRGLGFVIKHIPTKLHQFTHRHTDKQTRGQNEHNIRFAQSSWRASNNNRCTATTQFTVVMPRVGPGHPSSPLFHLLTHLFPFSLFPFFHWLYLFSSFVHPFPFYQNSPTPFPGRRS